MKNFKNNSTEVDPMEKYSTYGGSGMYKVYLEFLVKQEIVELKSPESISKYL
jgi:hypothetical protein